MEIIAVIVAAIGLSGAIVKYMATVRQNQREIKQELTEVHVLVNDRLTEALKRIEQLQATLEHADVEVPERPGRDG